MGDFYSVLRQSIIDRGLTAPEEREEAYAQARRAMINRLWAYTPPLDEDEIDQRIGQFDIAVAAIEDEVVEVFAAMDDVAAHDDDAGHVAGPPQIGHDADDYPPHFGGEAGDDGGEDIDEHPPRTREPRPSIDEASRAVELALLAADLDPDPDAAPGDPDMPAAHDEDLGGWTHADEEDGDGAVLATGAERPAPAVPADARKATGPKPKRAGPSLPERIREGLARSLSSSDPAHVRLLVAIVVALSLVLVGGIVWVLWPRTSSPVGPPVVLRTDVPGGVSDPDTAVRLPKEAIAVTSSFSLFDGQDPTVFESDPDNPVRFDGQLARIATSTSSAGAKVIIGAGLSSRLAGKTVRVTLDARSARENGATSMRFAYQSGVAISHWQTANLGADFTPLGLVWRVPAMRTDPTGDYIVIEPGLPGSGTAVEIRSVRIDLVDD